MSARKLLTPELNRLLIRFVRNGRMIATREVTNSAPITAGESTGTELNDQTPQTTAVTDEKQGLPPPSLSLFESMSDEYDGISTEQTLKSFYSMKKSIQHVLVDAVKMCDTAKVAMLKRDFANTGMNIAPNLAYEDYAFWLLRQRQDNNERDAYEWWGYAPTIQNNESSHDNEKRIARVCQYLKEMMIDKRSVDDIAEFALEASRHGYSEYVGRNAFRYIVNFGDKANKDFDKLWQQYVKSSVTAGGDKIHSFLISLRNTIIRAYISRGDEIVDTAMSMVEDLIYNRAGIPEPDKLVEDGQDEQTAEPWTLMSLVLKIGRGRCNSEQIERLNSLISKSSPALQECLESQRQEYLKIQKYDPKQNISAEHLRMIILKILQSSEYSSEDNKIEEAVHFYCVAMEKYNVLSAGTLSLIFTHMANIDYKDITGLERCRDKVSWALRERTGTLRQLWWTAIMLTTWRIGQFNAGVRVYREQFNTLGMPSLRGYAEEEDDGMEAEKTSEFVRMLCNMKPNVQWGKHFNSKNRASEGHLPFTRPNTFTITAGYMNLTSLTENVQELWDIYKAFRAYNGERKRRDPELLKIRSLRLKRAKGIYDLFIQKFCRLGGEAQAVAVMRSMLKNKIEPDERHWCLLLRGISHVYDQTAMDLLHSIERRKWQGVFGRWKAGEDGEEINGNDEDCVGGGNDENRGRLQMHLQLIKFTRRNREDEWLPRLSSRMEASLLMGFLDSGQWKYGEDMANRLRERRNKMRDEDEEGLRDEVDRGHRAEELEELEACALEAWEERYNQGVAQESPAGRLQNYKIRWTEGY